MTERPCKCCEGKRGVADRIVYVRSPYSGRGTCPRCKGSGVEPPERHLHPGLVLENVRSGKRWVIYADYGEGLWDARRWGIHRFKAAKHGGHYVWQIKLTRADLLLDERRWREVGFGDAWNHDLMRSDPL
jgi:hypothetical protein